MILFSMLLGTKSLCSRGFLGDEKVNSSSVSCVDGFHSSSNQIPFPMKRRRNRRCSLRCIFDVLSVSIFIILFSCTCRDVSNVKNVGCDLSSSSWFAASPLFGAAAAAASPASPYDVYSDATAAAINFSINNSNFNITNPMRDHSFYNTSSSYFDPQVMGYSFSRTPRLRTAFEPPNFIPVATEFYDYIVVGCGGAGCPIARTLADGGFKVLVIERGAKRSREETPAAMDIYGAGVAIGDKSISQLLVTEDGVRSHIGSVMGGGTSINMAIVIEEREEFLDFLEETYKGVKWDRKLVEKSYKWVYDRTASPMPEVEPYGVQWAKGLGEVGFPPVGNLSENGVPKREYSGRMSNGRWGGMSLFNSSDRFYRNAADVFLFGKNGESRIDKSHVDKLIVRSKHTVTKIEFDKSSSSTGGKPRASCVLYRPTLEEDTATIQSKTISIFGIPVLNWSEWLENLLNPFKSVRNFFNHYNPPRWNRMRKACINTETDGEIILSAGAILTPTILFRSGVGPKKQLEELEVDPVLEVSSLGQNISDRVLIPVGFFLSQEAPVTGFEPRICQTIGARPFGTNCKNYKVGERNLECTMATAEELSGWMIPEQTIYATRYIFPPQFRNQPVIEYLFNILSDCASGRDPYNNIVMSPACVVATPVIDCFKRVAANFYFTAEPKSRGSLFLYKDGSMRVHANYMQDKQDLFDAVRGVSNIIKIVNSDVYKGIIQPAGHNACPLTILNGLLDMLLHLSSTQTSQLISGHPEMLQSVQEHLENSIPEESRRRRRLLVDNKLVEIDDEEVVRRGYPRPVRIPADSSSSSMKTSEKEEGEAFTRNLEFKNKKTKTCKVKQFDSYTETCNETDVYGYARKLAIKDMQRIKESGHDLSSGSSLFSGSSWLSKSHLFKEKKTWKMKRSEDQWAATYPPILPDSDDPEAVAQYVMKYMTSIWHWTSSASMGDVVDSNFRVKGLEGLSIVDMSVLNQVTRMNPTSFIMMMGRYAGLLKLRQRGHDISTMLESSNYV